MKAYGFGEVLAHTGAARTQLIHWTHVKLITAGVRGAEGTGHQRVFSFWNLVEVTVTVALAHYGLSVKSMGVVLRAVGRHVRRVKREQDTLVFIVGAPGSPSAVWCGTRQEFAMEITDEAFIPKRTGILVDLGRIVGDLKERTGDRL